MFFCAISGEPPQDPVVSSKSGQVYERRLITKYIKENGTDPITGEKLEEEELIAVKASAYHMRLGRILKIIDAIRADPKASAPRPPTLSSIPTLLHTLQNEWDSLVLETFALKQQYNSTRQELSYALYAQDASVRVVARLIKERDAARECVHCVDVAATVYSHIFYFRALASVQASMGITPSGANGDVEMNEGAEPAGAIPQETLDQIEETHATLSAARKKRKAPAGSATPAQVKKFTASHTVPSLHSPSPAGITALALSTANPGQFLTGGNDTIVQLYDRGTDKVLASLKGHTKRVTRVALRERAGEPTLLLSAGADKVAKVWAHDAASGEYIPRSTIRAHKGALTGLAVHPIGSLAVLASEDGTYSLHDLRTFQQIGAAPPADAAFTALDVHPDGSLFGVGTETGAVLIYDLRTATIAATLQGADPAPGGVRTLSFSENGYQLAASGAPGTVAIWDLRNQTVAQSLALGEGAIVNSVKYDYSAKLVGVAASDGVRVFAHKTWDQLAHFEEGGEAVDVAWGPLSKEIWGVAGREVRIWG